jgi:glycosyltransferase involved in cell wall biosynthesis
MANIIYVSDSPTLPTGYGRVSKELTTSLHNAGHDITVIGWGFKEGQHNPHPYPIIPCQTHQENFGEDILARLIRDKKPDIVMTLGDPWMTNWFPSMEERKAVCWISYYPIDGYPIPKEWHSWIKDANVPVVFSKFSHKLVSEIIGSNPIYIPHGVDTEVFKPLPEKKELRKKILGKEDDLFVVGCVARNQPRKNLPALIRAFARFSQDREDVALYLHSQIRDVGWNLDELIERYSLTKKSYCTTGMEALQGVSDSQLNEIYNLFDVFALPTMAEGFGLPILEAHSVGVPVLVTDFSACRDLAVDKQELVKVKTTMIMGRNIEQAVIDEDDLVRKLSALYIDWKRKKSTRLRELGEKGRKSALTMDWKEVNGEFVSLIEHLEPQLDKMDKTIKPNFYRI